MRHTHEGYDLALKREETLKFSIMSHTGLKNVIQHHFNASYLPVSTYF